MNFDLLRHLGAYCDSALTFEVHPSQNQRALLLLEHS